MVHAMLHVRMRMCTLACYGGKIYMTSFGKVVQLGADLCC